MYQQRTLHRDYDELPAVDPPGHLIYTPDTESGPKAVWLVCVVHHEVWELAMHLLSEFGDSEAAKYTLKSFDFIRS